MATKEKSLASRLVSIVIIATVVVLIALAILGIFRLINNSTNISPNEKINISLSQTSINNGEEIELSWDHQNKTTTGEYRFSFNCDGHDLTIRFLDEDGVKVVNCNQDETIVGQVIRLRTELREDNTYLNTKLYIQHQANGKTTATGVANLTIRSESVGGGVSVGTTTNTGGNIGQEAWSTSTNNTNTNNNQNASNTNPTNYGANRPVQPIQPVPPVARYSDIYVSNTVYGCLVNNTFLANQDCSAYYNNNYYQNNTTCTNGRNCNNNNWNNGNYNSYNNFDWFNTDVNSWLGYNLDGWFNTSINGWLNYDVNNWSNYNNTWTDYNYNNNNYNYNNNWQNNNQNYDQIFNNYTYYSAKPAVRFNIGNQGNLPTGIWQFVASVPTMDRRVISSGWQNSLNPGEIMQFTLSMDSIAIGQNYAIIAVTKTQNEIVTNNNVGYVLTYGSRN